MVAGLSVGEFRRDRFMIFFFFFFCCHTNSFNRIIVFQCAPDRARRPIRLDGFVAGASVDSFVYDRELRDNYASRAPSKRVVAFAQREEFYSR